MDASLTPDTKIKLILKPMMKYMTTVSMLFENHLFCPVNVRLFGTKAQIVSVISLLSGRSLKSVCVSDGVKVPSHSPGNVTGMRKP